MKRLSMLFTILMIATMLVGCGQAPTEEVGAPTAEVVTETVKETVIVEPTPEPDERVMLRVAGPADDLTSLDPHFATTTQDRNVVDMLFNGLVRYEPGNAPNFEADLAEALPESEMVDGEQVWTFHLRRGVMCHPTDEVPSYELTAEDVVYSLQKSADPERSAYAGDYEGMTFEAVDDYTVEITLDDPLSEVLFFPKVTDYSGGFIICKKAAEALGDEGLKTNPVGTGPFMFESYSPQQKTTLVANDDYFRGQPLLGGVEYRYISDYNSRELAISAGELDLTEGDYSAEALARMRDEENVRVDVYQPGEVAVIHFNTTVAPLDNPDVRKALAYATSREDIVALYGEGSPVQPVYAPVPSILNGGLSRNEVEDAGLLYEVDRERARQMLADAGYADGFELEVVTSPMTGYRDIYESLQAQWAEVGVDVNINPVDHSTMHTMIREDANAFVVYTAWRPNAQVWLTRFYHSDSIVVTGESPDTNFSHYDQIDDLIESARTETDSEAQIQLWKEAQIQILEDMVAYPVRIGAKAWLRNPALDYGHEVNSTYSLYPQITEISRLVE